ncbi:MAG: hypothetical protein GY905_11625 [Gammaproteobacteria bacterium]|nr:hypothetical protein [Gammaproteobacteria bacterium]
MKKLNNILSTSTHKIESAGVAHKTTAADIEAEWQESELLRTDNWPSDRPPGAQAMADYRQRLRDYNNQSDFPNGTRPTL